jgi:hypothetical protein
MKTPNKSFQPTANALTEYTPSLLMEILKKIGLLLEFIIGFGFTIICWLIGLSFMLHAFLQVLAGVPNRTLSEAFFNPIFLLVFFGGMGIWGVSKLTLKLIFSHFNISNKRRLKLFLVFGILTSITYVLLSFLNGAIDAEDFFIAGLPVLVTLHFYYLARNFLQGNS